MSQHDSLREREEQHKPKNEKSKLDDKDVYKSMDMVMKYLQGKREFTTFFESEWDLEFSPDIKIKYMIDFIKRKKVRNEFNYEFIDRSIIPDGGILFLVNKKNENKLPLVIAEIKRQGTNKERVSEGKSKQAIGIRAMMNYEKITPFVCFG